MNLSRHVDKLVRLVWTDAVGASDWCSVEEAKATQLATITSVGKLLAAYEDRVVLAADSDDGGNVNSVTVVPRGWVVSCDRL